MSFVISFLVGTATGVLSGWGVGGGTLLMIYMTSFAGVAQQAAQGINLFYFLPTSATALCSHVKNKLVSLKCAIPAIIAGAPATLAAALVATAVDTTVLKKIFGVFLLFVGVMELFRKTEK